MDNKKLIIKWLFAEDLDNENLAACGKYLDNSIDIIKTKNKETSEYDWLLLINGHPMEEKFENKITAIIWATTYFNA